MSHGCHAIGCEKAVPPKMLFCLKHWRMVDADIQRLVWATYVPGQESRKDPTVRYLIVQSMAVAWVAGREGKLDKEKQSKHVAEKIWKWLPQMTDTDIEFVCRTIPGMEREKLRITRENMKTATGAT